MCFPSNSLIKDPHNVKVAVTSRGFLVRPGPLEIFFPKDMKRDRVRVLSHIKILVLTDLSFLLPYHLLRRLPGGSY